MVLVGGATRGFPEGAAPPMAAIFTRGKARRPALRFFTAFDQSKKGCMKVVLFGFTPLFFVAVGCL